MAELAQLTQQQGQAVLLPAHAQSLLQPEALLQLPQVYHLLPLLLLLLHQHCCCA
jgi:hypothetical protein